MYIIKQYTAEAMVEMPQTEDEFQVIQGVFTPLSINLSTAIIDNIHHLKHQFIPDPMPESEKEKLKK